jgi:hypothetical protein
MPRTACYLVIGKDFCDPRQCGRWWRWAGKTRSRSDRGRSEEVALVREVLSVTAVHLTSCGEGYGRAPARPTKGAADATAAAVLCLRRCWWFSQSCPGS